MHDTMPNITHGEHMADSYPRLSKSKMLILEAVDSLLRSTKNIKTLLCKLMSNLKPKHNFTP